MKTAITNGVILTPFHKLTDYTLLIENGLIIGIEDRVDTVALQNFNVIDAKGCFVIPGLIDLHAHGAYGADTMDATFESLNRMSIFFACHGVTSFLPTTVTASEKDTLRAIENVSIYKSSVDGAQILGIHLEGPYLNEIFRGAQPQKHLRSADPVEYEKWFPYQTVRLISVAPEIEGVMELIRRGREEKIEFAIGHSNASYEKVLEAVELGLRQVTHIFNGMPPLHHRSPGIVGAALSDHRLFTQVILDGIHVHPAVIKILIASKGIDRVIAITDSIRASGLEDGEYTLGDQTVIVINGIARTKEGGLAGSTLTLDQGLRNTLTFTDLSLQEVLPMFTSVPAMALDLEFQKGCLRPSADADIVLLDSNYSVRMSMVRGRMILKAL